MGSTLRNPHILPDQNAAKRLIRELPEYEIRTARQMGWSQLSNGDLIAAAERDGFDLLITADRNLRYQQNITRRSLAIVVLETNRWQIVEANLDLIIQAVQNAAPSTFAELMFSRWPTRQP